MFGVHGQTCTRPITGNADLYGTVGLVNALKSSIVASSRCLTSIGLMAAPAFASGYWSVDPLASQTVR